MLEALTALSNEAGRGTSSVCSLSVIADCVSDGKIESEPERRTGESGQRHRRTALARAGYESQKQVHSRFFEALLEVL